MRSLIITTLLLAGCPKTPTPTTAAESSEFASSAWVLTDSGLRYEDLVLGTGATITPNSRAEVHYVGKLGDGTTFDSSYDRGKPFGLTVGTGMVIKGWDEGLLGMREGGKRKLLIPPHLGYGSSGTGPIPPNSTLEFEVEVLSVKAPRVPSAAPALVDVSTFRTTESGLMIAAIDGSCEGEPHPAGTILTFEVDGFLDTGKLVVTSRLSDEPTMVAAGLGQAEPGLDEGLVNTPLGCKNQVRVPSELAYRDMERPPEAVAGVGLVYDIEVLEVAPPRVAPEAPREAGNHLQSGTGLAVAILEPGEGEGAKAGDVVVVEYTGWLEDGTRFDSSFLRPKPISFVLGQGRVIAGWEEGLMGMRVGEQRQLIIPPDLAYGAQGRPPTIPASATLIFEVELTGIE